MSTCGGGGDGGATDTVAPTITITPVVGATAESLSFIIEAVFNEEMLASTIDANSFTLSNAAGVVNATVSFTNANSTALLTPDSALA